MLLVLRRIVCFLVLLALAATPALAKEKKRHAKQGQPPLGGPSTGGEQRDETKDEQRRKEPPIETEGERRRRWERWLRGKDRLKIRSALRELADQETSEATGILIAFAKRTRDDGYRVTALGALGWRGNREAVAFLKGPRAAASSQPTIAAAGCRALGAVGEEAVRPFLAERLDGELGEVAAGALAGIVLLDRRAESLPDLLARCAMHESEHVRAEVAASLAVARVQDWRDRLARLGEDPAPRVRAAVCATLGKREDEASAPLLMRLQSADPDEGVRQAALAALVAIEEALSAE